MSDGERETAAVRELFETKDMKARCKPETLAPLDKSHEYLFNRIWKSVQDGITIGRRLEREKMCDRFAAFVRGEAAPSD